MAVDEKYVEVVGEEKETESFDDILEEFGAEASFQEDDSGITLPTDYYKRELKTLPVDELFEGKPHLGNVETIKWTDKETGEENTNYQVKLFVIDDDEAEAYIIPINLKSPDNYQKNVHNASKLYTLQMGLMELKSPGISKAYNQLDLVNLDVLRKKIEAMENMVFKVVEIVNGDFTYLSFRIQSDFTY